MTMPGLPRVPAAEQHRYRPRRTDRRVVLSLKRRGTDRLARHVGHWYMPCYGWRRAYGLRDEEYFRLKVLTCRLPAL